MKKILFILCVLLFFVSCKKEQETGKLKVVVTVFPLYDFAREIGGDRVSIKMLVPLGAGGHSYEPSPQDIIAVQNADVFLFIGGESDEWVRKISGSAGTRFMEDEEHEGHEEHEEEYDEHIWTNPKNAMAMAKKIAEVFSEKDTLNRDFYKKKSTEFVASLTALDSSFAAIVQNAKRKTVIFGDRFPFKHFAEEYGLEYHAAFPGCSHEIEPSAAAIAFLIDKVKAEEIPVVFHIELSNENIASTVAEATGAKRMLLHSVHNISQTDFEAGESYLSLMKKNAEALGEALR
ncbi:MAG: metal ABC transporter substrate-binding protein [Candidatus Fibromonas sp.]|jgi:zinc transport system substrate-binding protein|nr:metal ABC transporter substrate-binding protein [Candidatus Fibromonas sp.]